jgi:hypothetical protein
VGCGCIFHVWDRESRRLEIWVRRLRDVFVTFRNRKLDRYKQTLSKAETFCLSVCPDFNG